MNPSRRTGEPAPKTAGLPDATVNLSGTPFVNSVDDWSFLSPPRGEGELGWLQHYRVLRKLGAGGMGVVLLAEDSHLKRPVALKIMLPALAADGVSRQRFLREARAMAAVRHERVVTVYQVGLATSAGNPGDDLPFMAMEYLEGETLHERLVRESRLPPAETARIGREIAEGLSAAHAKGLIHRDIKPSNVWLVAPDGRVKILDFGLVLVAESIERLSRSGQVIGTPNFMSPEQARGETVFASSDLFSLGGLLYTALTGSLPFEGRSPSDVLMKLTSEDPAPLAQLRPDCPRALIELVQRLMAKRPENRLASAADAARLLGDIEFRLGNSPAAQSEATPPPGRSDTIAQLSASATRPPTGGAAPPGPARPNRSRGVSRRHVLIGAGTALAAGAGWAVVHSIRGRGDADAPNYSAGSPVVPGGEPIPVGILESFSGPWRDWEIPVAQAVQLALEEINKTGGLLGRSVRPVMRDGGSSARSFSREAERLLVQDSASVLFGCRTSASRKAVLPLLEQHRGLLFYSAHYEGLERSPSVVYTGAIPSQSLVPAVDVCVEKNPKAKYFLLGSNGLYSRCCTEILRHALAERKVQVAGEALLAGGPNGPRDVAAAIKKVEPAIILNTLRCGGNHALFAALRAAGISPFKSPMVAFDLDEQTLRMVPSNLVAGEFVVASYFAAAPASPAAAFANRYRARWGDAHAVTDAMASAYMSVRLWAQAVAAAGSAEREAVRKAVRGERIDAPEGTGVRIDSETQHAWKYLRIGQVTLDGTIKVVVADTTPRPPQPFPRYRSPAEWERFEHGLFESWKGNWSPPG